jgi:hypothetical protein
MKWRKIGKIFEPDGSVEWMRSYAAVPFAEHVEDDLFKIYFSSRDSLNRSFTSFLLFNMQSQHVVEVALKPVLTPGKLGTFDDSGAMGSCLVNVGTKKYLYYIGWNLGVTVPFRNAIGLAISADRGTSFIKCFDGPIIERTYKEPHFTASSCVLYEDGVFKIWYLSCVKWQVCHNHPKHVYHIKYAESNDGIHWIRNGVVAIDFKNEYEYAISVPRVIKEENIYKMWYSFRGSPVADTYRIGYAESRDGRNWIRKDEKAGIDVSETGWDSEMICYPFVFDHKGRRYMLYNGNGYGKTGFGLAILEQD